VIAESGKSDFIMPTLSRHDELRTKLVTVWDSFANEDGGYYKEVHRAADSIPCSAIPERLSGSRSFATDSYFSLELLGVAYQQIRPFG
jgi:hypothetical protein